MKHILMLHCQGTTGKIFLIPLLIPLLLLLFVRDARRILSSLRINGVILAMPTGRRRGKKEKRRILIQIATIILIVGQTMLVRLTNLSYARNVVGILPM